MTVTYMEDTAHEPALEILIHALHRLTLVSYTAILTEIKQSLLEIDRRAEPSPVPRVEWGIRQVEGSRDIRVVLSPVQPPQRRSVSSVTAASLGLVSGVESLAGASEIPDYFSAGTVERIQRVGKTIEAGDVAAIDLSSINGKRVSASVTPNVIQRAKEAVRPATSAYASVHGRLSVLDAKNPNRLRAELTLSNRGAVGLTANPEQSELLKDAWGHQVTASGLLTRNASGQPVRMVLDGLTVDQVRTERVSAWDVLGALPHATGDLSTREFMESIRNV